MKFKLLAVVCGIVLAGCASSPSKTEKCPQSHSEAMCILSLAGISEGARDMSRSDLKNTQIDVAKLSQTSSISIDPGFLVMGGLERLSPTRLPGLGAGTAGSVFFFASVMSGKSPGELTDLIAIIPDHAVVGGDPKATVQAYVLDAFAAQLGAKLAPAPVIRVQKHLVGETKYQEQKMFGGKCGTEGCYSNVYFSHAMGASLDKSIPIDLPSWYGSGRAHVITKAWPAAYRDPKNAYKSAVSSEADTLGMMARLPNWFYFYKPGSPSLLISSDKVRVLVKPN